MARDEKVVFRLTEDIKQEFQTVAEGLGMTISALGSYVVGDYLRRLKNEKAFQEKLIEPTVQQMSQQMKELDAGQLGQAFEIMAAQLKQQSDEQNRP